MRFGPNDRFAVKQVFENVQMMQSMNFTPKAMEEYMADCGMLFKSKVFQPPETAIPSANPRSLDMMASRTGKGTGEANAKIGTGSQGTTREDQLKKQ